MLCSIAGGVNPFNWLFSTLELPLNQMDLKKLGNYFELFTCRDWIPPAKLPMELTVIHLQ